MLAIAINHTQATTKQRNMGWVRCQVNHKRAYCSAVAYTYILPCLKQIAKPHALGGRRVDE